MNRFLRMTAVVLAAAFAFLLAGCGGSSASTSFTWFVDNIPANLDPQVATKAEDVIACENLYGGLVRRNASGELVPDLCERWEISSDGLTYTFYLKSGLTYTGTKGAATDYAITAEDFVYAFRRVFDPQTASPYAVEFSAIQNSAAVLDGTADPGTLGVSAIGELTLVFRLSERDDTFLSKLILPGAMPCDEAFFESTRGTYGLSSASTLSSGSFYIYNWTASGLFLRRSAASPLVNNLRLVQNTSNTDKSAAQLIADEKCSAALDDTAEATSLQSVEYSDTTWALLFNASEGSVFAVASLRQALRQFRKINRTPRGIHHKKEFIIGNTVDNQVVNHAAFVVQQKIVTAGTGLLIRDTACQSRIQGNVTPLPLHPEFPHMADVEQRHRPAGVFMLRKNSIGILHRHIPAGERHHFRPQSDMFRRKRRFQQHFFRHTHLTILNYSCVKSRGSTFRHSMTISLAMTLSSRKHAASPNLT